eukprot:NODE_1807_length_1599_cov_29.774390_g1721_i0.p1 GENE.NODE_1807_length_1599_cov_29.774390_g1721_i0~~NODE_1807_length_1599_cov_29.774390_g1721_i0.p1  ORF type:complete len:471 (+),score=53.40 NODE_1807_length_1599_cov_29.774390_g1721_i0:116-1528(+)
MSAPRPVSVIRQRRSSSDTLAAKARAPTPSGKARSPLLPPIDSASDHCDLMKRLMEKLGTQTPPRHWWYPELAGLERDRGFGFIQHFCIPQGIAEDGEELLEYLRKLLSSAGGSNGGAWLVDKETPEESFGFHFCLVSPMLVGTSGMQEMCKVLSQFGIVADSLEVVFTSMTTYIAATELETSHLQSLCQHWILFETGFEILVPSIPANTQTRAMRAGRRLGKRTVRESLLAISGCADIPAVMDMVNPKSTGTYVLDLQGLSDAAHGTRWHQCLAFNLTPNGCSWRVLQPWILTLLLFVDNTINETHAQFMHRKMLLAKYDSKWIQLISPYEICYDMFNLLVHSVPLYLIIRQQFGDPKRMRNFLGSRDDSVIVKKSEPLPKPRPQSRSKRKAKHRPQRRPVMEWAAFPSIEDGTIPDDDVSLPSSYLSLPTPEMRASALLEDGSTLWRPGLSTYAGPPHSQLMPMPFLS